MEESASRGGLTRRGVLIAASFLAMFLLGFVPQYRSASAARKELQSAQAEVHRLREDAARSRLRDLSAMVLYETVQRNFGIAARHSSALFDGLQEMAASGGAGQEQLRQALAARDAVTAGLAAADPAVQAEVIRVFRLVLDATRRP